MHIIGANGHAKVIASILFEEQREISGVWDDNFTIETMCGFPIKGNITAFSQLKIDDFIIGIGNNKIRKKIATQLIQTKALAIHPTSAVAKSASIGFGSVLMANTSVNTDASIGKHVIINTNASVDHDCIVGDFVHISPQVGLAGNVVVGEGTHIGIGACVIQGIKIGKWVTLGAGAVVIKDVPDYAVVVGNPAKIIKYNSIETNER